MTLLLGPFAFIAGALQPDSTTWFRYDYFQKVDQGTGDYSGWGDETRGTGYYDVLRWGPENVTMKTIQHWNYRNDDGESKEGGLNRVFSFSLSNRKYTTETDLDDPPYNTMNATLLAQWLWVPPALRQGERIDILDETWTVTGTDVVLWSKWLPRRLIEVSVSGDDERHDDYGDLSYDYTDRLYFDKETGMFFAERYEEYDEGTLDGVSAGFRMTIEIDVTSSSYPVETDWGLFAGTVAMYSALITLIAGAIAYGAYRIRWRQREFPMDTMVTGADGMPARSSTTVKLRRVRKMQDFPLAPATASVFFGPFLRHWTEKALAGKDRVAVATSPELGLGGIAFYNKEARIGTVLCTDSDLAETLRWYVGAKDFFSEVLYTVREEPDYEMDDEYGTVPAPQQGQTLEAYNVFETHKVYRLAPIPPSSPDRGLVRPMRAGDIAGAAALARRVWRLPARRWISSCLESGDLGYVAEIDGRMAGFGLACVCGTHGRLHTLAVDSSFQGRGIGKQLHRARLEAMRLLGVTDVIDEIADWNLASIRISTLSGFQPIGKMYVETVRTRRIKKDIVRRW